MVFFVIGFLMKAHNFLARPQFQTHSNIRLLVMYPMIYNPHGPMIFPFDFHKPWAKSLFFWVDLINTSTRFPGYEYPLVI